jgi:cis-3-alkyl-4-acyloxetan-2-one decarboxylase
MSVDKIRYAHDFGGDGELIVLLHGFLGSKWDWSKLAPKLVREGYRVVAIDLLGFGRAPKPFSATYDYEDHIEHIDKVLAELTIEGPFILIGHSMGALIAQRYTLQHSQNVKKLVLLHPPLYRDRLQVYETLRGTSYLFRFLLDSKYRNIAWPIIRLAMAGRMRHMWWSRERSLKNVIEKAEAFRDLVKLKKDTLLFVGLYDRPDVYIKNLEQLAVSDSVSVMMQDVGHMSPMKQPRRVKRAVLQFLAQ